MSLQDSGRDGPPGISVAQLLSALASTSAAQSAGGAAAAEAKKELQVSFCHLPLHPNPSRWPAPQPVAGADEGNSNGNSNCGGGGAKAALTKNNSIPKIRVGEPTGAKLFKSLSLKRFTERRKLYPSASELVSLAPVKENPDACRSRTRSKDSARYEGSAAPPASEAGRQQQQRPEKSKPQERTRYKTHAKRQPRFLFSLLLSSNRQRTSKSQSQPTLQMPPTPSTPPTPPAGGGTNCESGRQQPQPPPLQPLQLQLQLQAAGSTPTPPSDSQHSPSLSHSLPTPQGATPVTVPRRKFTQVQQVASSTSPRLGRPSSVGWIDAGGVNYTSHLSPLVCIASSNSAIDAKANAGAGSSLPHVNSFSAGTGAASVAGGSGYSRANPYRQSYARQQIGSRSPAPDASSCSSAAGTCTTGSAALGSSSSAGRRARGGGANCKANSASRSSVGSAAGSGSGGVAGVRELITVQANFVFPSPRPSPRFSLYSPDVNPNPNASQQFGLGSPSSQTNTADRAHRFSQSENHELLTRPATAPTLLGLSARTPGPAVSRAGAGTPADR